MNSRAKEFALGIIVLLLMLAALILVFKAKYSSEHCGGVERWSVKTLQDGFVPGAPVQSTIAKEIALPAPKNWNRTLTRQPIEKVCVTINCKIVAVGVEADSDFHLVLSDGKNTMIGEIPKPECASAQYATQFAGARNEVVRAIARYPKAIKTLSKPIPCEVTGVRFFDEPGHNGTGHAKTEVEVHPILKVKIL